jgi:hypothetical protein
MQGRKELPAIFHKVPQWSPQNRPTGRHESILTTERYLGSEQDLKNAVNDALVFE